MSAQPVQVTEELILAKLMEVVDQFTELQEQIGTLHGQIGSLHGQIDLLQEQIGKLQDTITTLTNANTTLTEKLSAATINTPDTLPLQMSRVEQRLEDMNARLLPASQRRNPTKARNTGRARINGSLLNC
ncbi:hypothetical protein BX661DRAFT_178934 [Kickxella alabastrina]|uniref:uncharacterized protein n=1 Tax=Kickxella alabastrina TaxID=61397 RepID=UPI00221E68B5|nr:uncharacterized protein BX661DRAFT_178934 [Kickxella alabastrina]KAI7832999.1 hypothetical protein BX661DRAFT_178934 [Kickxella alabastrina]